MESGLVLRPEAHLNSEERDNGVASPNTVPQQPVKKPTRQWAAWTRQEEESFFTALRQVGKNFEKITRRVQSKNKDQVRHYYYRLVRRMNKLLGQGLYLDAKNSKDTNAAMLRWWSLLEKYSCKASKLHLKPRRFKIFVEALELQLLKDRKKSVRKRPQVEYTPTSGAVTTQRVPGQGNRSIKLVLVDNQSIQKVGSGKTSLKRHGNVGINRGCSNKGDSNIMKPARQRRKPAVVSSAAYKKWEKAAIAGVSLVADAAEHLERTSSDKEPEQDLNTSGTEKSSDPVELGLLSLPIGSQNPFVENGLPSSAKLKLQLFPIDDGTRRALEMDKHNPHLELTLSTRKKIASVLEHMNRKWGNSNVAAGELILFPYGAQRENLVGCQRWAQDSAASAADVFSMIGSPPVFRLRYGWFPNVEPGNITVLDQTPVMASSCGPSERDPNMERTDEAIVSAACISPPSTNYQPVDIGVDNLVSVDKSQSSTLNVTNMCNKRRYSSTCPNDYLTESSNPAVNKSWHGRGANDRSVTTQLGDTDDPRLGNGNGISAGEWADSLTNISVGDLLSGVSLGMNDSSTLQPVPENSHCLQQMAFSCDSFDAAIAAHISRQKEKIGSQPTLASDASSIWDADEACDGFSFHKKTVQSQNQNQNRPVFASPSTCKQAARASLADSYHLYEELSNADEPTGDFSREEQMDDCGTDQHLSDNQVKDFTELADIYWPESLGPLDLDIPSSKYHSEDLILSDSLGGLNRLIASSLDAFQNCSFFGLDKKDTTSTVEARETASFSNFKTESGLRATSD